MQFLDFLTVLPAEEKNILLDLLEETGSIDTAVRTMMLILAGSEPELASRLEGPVGDWLNNTGPTKNGNVVGPAHELGKPGSIALKLQRSHS